MKTSKVECKSSTDTVLLFEESLGKFLCGNGPSI